MRKRFVLMVGAMGIGLAGCQDTAGPTGDRLSRAEALHLMTQVMASSEGAATTSMQMGASAGAENAGPPVSFTQTHESMHPCPAGGQLAVAFEVNGSYDEDTQSFQADLAGSHTHAECALPQNGRTLTLNGQPSVNFAISIGAVNGVPSQPFTFSLDGALQWASSDGRSGVCPLDVDAVTDFAAQQRTVQGAVCGHTFDQTLSWN